jgi:glycosyltransferase involved in cell wall biosynthesis
MRKTLPPYIIITSVKDEAAHLRTVVASLCAQDPAPVRWYITDDGSSDGSRDILREAAEEYRFITLIEKPKREGRCWGVQYQNMNEMYARAVTEIAFDYLGCTMRTSPSTRFLRPATNGGSATLPGRDRGYHYAAPEDGGMAAPPGERPG